MFHLGIFFKLGAVEELNFLISEKQQQVMAKVLRKNAEQLSGLI